MPYLFIRVLHNHSYGWSVLFKTIDKQRASLPEYCNFHYVVDGITDPWISVFTQRQRREDLSNTTGVTNHAGFIRAENAISNEYVVALTKSSKISVANCLI